MTVRAGSAGSTIADLGSLYRFGRPHTLLGTAASAVCLFVMAVPREAAARAPGGSIRLLATALIAALLANVAIVGLNQIFDVDIDRANKPYLPLASGAIEPSGAWAIVLACAVASVAIAAHTGPWLLVTVAAGLALGAAYSAPPLRLKRWPALAAGAIALVRGPIVNAGLWLHLRWSAGLAPWPGQPVVLLTSVMTLISLAIAVSKDVPDVCGDRRYGIMTLALSRGERAAVKVSMSCMAAAFTAALVAGQTMLGGTARAGWAVWNLVAALTILAVGTSTLGTLPIDNKRFYRVVWALFYLEYIAFAIAFAAA